MSNINSQSNSTTSKLSLTLASLQPKLRTTNQEKIAKHYDDIIGAIKRGVSMKDIRAALAEDGVNVASVTFKKLLDIERKRRALVDEEARLGNGGAA